MTATDRLRALALAMGIAIAIGLAVPALAQQGRSAPSTMTAAEAHARAQAGEVVLIDIRTPEEWRETGLPTSAHAIDMYEDPKVFAAKLLAAVGGDRTRRIALICRTGNRSTQLSQQLLQAGFTNVVDVSEGVVGGRYGKGWLKSGLPTRPGTMASVPPSVPASVPGRAVPQ